MEEDNEEGSKDGKKKESRRKKEGKQMKKEMTKDGGELQSGPVGIMRQKTTNEEQTACVCLYTL